MRTILALLFAGLLLSCTVRGNSNLHSEMEGEININVDELKSIPHGAKRLIECYDKVVAYSNNNIFFEDGGQLLYDDGKEKSFDEMLNRSDIEDMFHYPYDRQTIPPQSDPGRIRSEELMKRLYGSTRGEVEIHLVRVDWCPKLLGEKVRFTSLYGAADALRRVSEELDRHPEWREYLKGASTLNWRYIAGTKRLSPHSFGNAIDIAVPYSDYWQWSKGGEYRNRIPMGIVEIFEKHGFIWGGRWASYDTMHFEYRPELF